MIFSFEREKLSFDPKVVAVCVESETGCAWLRLLRENGIQVLIARSPDEAEHLWAVHLPDLAVIDAGRLRFDALRLCERLRQLTVIPILLFADPMQEDYALAAYRAGVDECTLRPKSAELALAKIQAWLRRARTVPAEELNPLQAGELRLEPAHRTLVLEDGRQVHLSMLEFRLLFLLMSRLGKAISNTEIVHRVWGFKGGGSHTMLKNLVYRLRRKIERDPAHPQHLVSEGRWGYRFEQSRSPLVG